jgi:signal transduction histidine kinase
MIKITFRDNGIGMDEKTTKNLFNPFFTTKDKGVGLGMALTHKIIEDHRGTIEVMSEQRRGSTFIVRLPVTKM